MAYLPKYLLSGSSAKSISECFLLLIIQVWAVYGGCFVCASGNQEKCKEKTCRKVFEFAAAASI